jgi:CRISPR-associated exonuclease Cas4
MMDTQAGVLITPSDIIEYLFCRRFIYFMYSAGIPQFEERRYKVQRGRQVHEIRQQRNTEYLWRKIGCVGREMSIYLSSSKYHLRGIVDEVLMLEDGTRAPMDYKFAEYRDKIFNTHKFQTVCYGMLIRENYQCEVNRGYLLYTRSNTFKEIPITDNDEKKLMDIIDEILYIINDGYYPNRTTSTTRCADCTYKNICSH